MTTGATPRTLAGRPLPEACWTVDWQASMTRPPPSSRTYATPDHRHRRDQCVSRLSLRQSSRQSVPSTGLTRSTSRPLLTGASSGPTATSTSILAKAAIEKQLRILESDIGLSESVKSASLGESPASDRKQSLQRCQSRPCPGTLSDDYSASRNDDFVRAAAEAARSADKATAR